MKPTLANGTRDFGPKEMNNRKYIFSIMRKTFEKYGFVNIETPAIENNSTLNKKYGNEASQLIFKIINSGNFLSKIKIEDINKGYKNIIDNITKKGMRYDLTIPLIRYIVMNSNKIIFPFKRYQIQNVWRSDRPQKNRYKEFCQCDIDIVGSKSKICEIEIILIISEIFHNLKIKNYKIIINNKKILESISRYIKGSIKENLIFITIDKVHKIGIKKILKFLEKKKIPLLGIKKLKNIFRIKGDNLKKKNILSKYLKKYKIGINSLNEINEIIKYINNLKIKNINIEFDHTLSRGLTYYTDFIFEIKITNIKESLGGGGRYNNLTNLFGLSNISGIGFSFGIDRIYNFMKEMNLFPHNNNNIKIMITNLNKKLLNFLIKILFKLRKINIASELYLNTNKLKKQLIYANKKNINYIMLIKEDKSIILKNMTTGKQYKNTFNNLIKTVKKMI